MTSFDRYLLVAVRYGLFAVFFLPFVVLNTYLYPWVAGKIWGFEILVELLFPLWVLLAFRRKEFRPSRNLLLWAVVAYFGVVTLAALLGDNLHRSFWSKPDRLTGLFFRFHLLAFFLMAGAAWRGVQKRVIIAAVASASVMAAYGILQRYTAVGGEVDRASGTLGNPSYFAQYLMPHLLLVVWLLLKDDRKRRWLWGLAGALILLGIFAAKSRGAAVGTGLTVLAALLLGSALGSVRWRRRSRIGLVGLAALIGLFFLLDRSGPAHDWLYNQRWSAQYLKESARPRLLLVENALKGIAARPFLGWGPENFESAYYYFYDPETLRYSDYETRQDRPHNIVLDVLVNEGALGLLAYASIFAAAWYLLLKKKEGRAERAVLGLVTVAHVGTNLFIFETPVSYAFMYVFLALIAATVGEEREKEADRLELWGVYAAAAAAALSLAAWLAGVRGTAAASKATARIIIGYQSGMTVEQISAELMGLRGTRAPLLERNLRAITSHLSAAPGERVKPDRAAIVADLGMEEYRYLAERHPNDYVLALVASAALMSLPDRSPEQQAALEESVARARALAPNRQEADWLEAELRVSKGEYDLAEALYRRAVELDPENVISVARLARFHLRHGDPGTAFEALAPRWKEFRVNTAASDAVNGAMVRLFDDRDFERLYAVYEAAMAHGIEGAEWRITGIAAAAGLGQIDEARSLAEETKKLHPERAETVDVFLKAHLPPSVSP